MAMTEKQRQTLAQVPIFFRRAGPTFEPTILLRDYLPLASLHDVSPSDIIEYGQGRGWTELDAGCVLGAARMLWYLQVAGDLRFPTESE